MKQIKFAKTGYILISILFYLSGILCLIIPDISGKAIAIAGGIILIAYGIIKITGYIPACTRNRSISCKPKI